MAEFKVEGDELKKLIKLGKKRPLPFAFCPGSKDEDHTLLIHRKRKPEALGKAARKEGESNKVAFGTFEVKGKLMKMTCVRELPAMSRRLKKYLKIQKLTMNVIILDADGNELESDIEELEDDPDWDQDDGDDLDGGDDAGTDDVEDDDDDDQPLAADAADDGATSPAIALAARIDAARAAVGAVPGDVGAKLQNALSAVAQLVKGGDFGKADQVMGQVEQALAKLGGGGGAAAGNGADPAAAQWQTAAAKLEPAVLAAMSSGKGDQSALGAAWAYATEKAEAGDYAGALKTAPRLVQLIKDIQAAGQTGAASEIQVGLVRLGRSRLAWIDTRKALRQELEKLKGAIDTTLSQTEGMEGAVAETGALFDYIDKLDERLEKTLEQMVETPDGDKREDLKKLAIDIIKDYHGELDSPFFLAVDGDNGFVKVNVRAAAMDSLKNVSDALSVKAA